MSVKIMSHVWDNSQQKGSALLLMLALADFADDSGFSWPSLPTLAQRTRLGVRQTHNIIGQAAESGELFAHKRDGKSSQYLILLGCDRATFTDVLIKKMGISAEETAVFANAIFSTTPALHCTPAKIAPLQPSSITPAMECRSPLQPIADDPSRTIITREEGLSSLWLAVQAELKHALPQDIYQLHFQATTAVALEGNLLTIRPIAPTSVTWINGRLNATIQRLASGVAGRQIEVKGVMPGA